MQYARCAGCGWWRQRWWPNNYFVGETVIGTLHAPEPAAVESAVLALDEFERDAHWLAVNSSDVERRVGAVMAAACGAEAMHVGRSGDGGIDVLLFDSEDGPIAVQVKHRRSDRRAESVSVVRELRGAMVLRGLSRGIVVTTADRFSPAASEAARAAPHHTVKQAIELVDARRLLDVLRLVVASGQGDDAVGDVPIDPYWPSVGPQSDETVAADSLRNIQRVLRRGLDGYIC